MRHLLIVLALLGCRDRVVTITTDGHLTTHPIPELLPPQVAWTVLDRTAQIHDEELWSLARNTPLPAGSLTGDGELLLSARAFAAWKQAGAKPRFKGPVSIEFVDRYITGGFVEDALELYATLLSSKIPSAIETRAKHLGLALATMLDSQDAGAPLVAALYKRWPTDRKIVLRHASNAETSTLMIHLDRSPPSKSSQNNAF